MSIQSQNAAQMYKETAIKTADSGKLIVLLYEEIEKNLTEAISLLENNNHQVYDKINYHITKAQSIITELASVLDKTENEEIYNNLLSLYLFFNKELSSANINKEAQKIIEVRATIRELLEAWRIAVDTTIIPQTPQKHSGINITG